MTERGSIEVNIYQGRGLVAKDVNGKKAGLQVTGHLRLGASSPFEGNRKKYTRECQAKGDAWIASLAQVESLLAGYREFRVSVHFTLDNLSERERELRTLHTHKQKKNWGNLRLNKERK